MIHEHDLQHRLAIDRCPHCYDKHRSLDCKPMPDGSFVTRCPSTDRRIHFKVARDWRKLWKRATRLAALAWLWSMAVVLAALFVLLVVFWIRHEPAVFCLIVAGFISLLAAARVGLLS